jgi:hypothetical protein
VKLWPSDEFVIETPLAPREVATVVAAETQERFTYFSWAPVLTIRGTVSESGFRLSRISFAQRGFQPLAVGTITPNMSGSIVVVHTRLDTVHVVISCLWFGFLAIFAAVLLAAPLRGERVDPLGFLAVGGLAVFGYTLTTMRFWFDAHRIESSLRRLIAQPASGSSPPPSAG